MFFIHKQNNRITNLRTAAEVFLIQIIEIGSRVGIVTFESSAYEKSPLLQITSVATRQRLVQNLPTTAGGGTKICAGIEKGLEVKYSVLLQRRATKMIRGLEHLSYRKGRESWGFSAYRREGFWSTLQWPATTQGGAYWKDEEGIFIRVCSDRTGGMALNWKRVNLD